MKVILLQDVPKLGKKNDVKEVADGFGRNYLIPKGLAEAATESVVNEATQRKAGEEKRAEEELRMAQDQAALVDGVEVQITSKANELGELYAQVPAKTIAEALGAKGYTVLAKQIAIPNPIKHIGEHAVTLTFNDGIEAEVKVVVVPEVENAPQ